MNKKRQHAIQSAEARSQPQELAVKLKMAWEDSELLLTDTEKEVYKRELRSLSNFEEIINTYKERQLLALSRLQALSKNVTARRRES